MAAMNDLDIGLWQKFKKRMKSSDKNSEAVEGIEAEQVNQFHAFGAGGSRAAPVIEASAIK
tara:strand:- start:675 stop:857 length:183 start_codon:yes stop_codon:yes gene_type:complete